MAKMITCDECGKTYRIGIGGPSGKIEFPPPKPYDTSTGKLPGAVPDKEDLEGVWLFTTIEGQAQPDTGAERLFQSLQLWLREDGTYDLTYQAYWGLIRNASDPHFNGMQARESGRYHISREILLLEPETTHVTRRKHGARTVETVANDRQGYIVRRERRLLHLAGPCAQYQVEPICSQSANVWYSLLLTGADKPAEIPDL
jgi:hypothetical protein